MKKPAYISRTALEPTMAGKLLNRVHNARKHNHLLAENELWDRNKLLSPASREGYKIATTKTLQFDGTEVVEYRLYKLIDATVSRISSTVETQVLGGLENLLDAKEVPDGEATTDKDN